LCQAKAIRNLDLEVADEGRHGGRVRISESIVQSNDTSILNVESESRAERIEDESEKYRAASAKIDAREAERRHQIF
jgi:hypothetical protein